MGAQMVFLLLAAVAGATMAAQGTINSALGKAAGLAQATFLVHLVGLAAAGIMLLPNRSASWNEVLALPWYSVVGGILGVGIIYGVAAVIPRLGVAVATTAIIVGQVGLALVIDHFGWSGVEPVPVSLHRLGGLVLLALGARLMLG